MLIASELLPPRLDKHSQNIERFELYSLIHQAMYVRQWVSNKVSWSKHGIGYAPFSKKHKDINTWPECQAVLGFWFNNLSLSTIFSVSPT